MSRFLARVRPPSVFDSNLALVDNVLADGASTPADFVALLFAAPPVGATSASAPLTVTEYSALDDECFGDEAFARPLENPDYQ